MKKAIAIVAFVAAMFISGNVQAQSIVYAGFAPETFDTNYTFVTGNTSTSTNYKGFFAGFTQNFRLSQGKVGIGVATGAYFRFNTRSHSEWGKTTKSSQFLIDVPIPFNFTININRDYSITPFFVGPMLSLALAGNDKVKVGNSTSTNDWYDNSWMSRFNLYAVFGTGAMINHFNIYCGYRLGLLDLDSSDNATLKTNGLFVGIGYTL